VGTGVYDFFYEPIKGIIKSPKDFTVYVKTSLKFFTTHMLRGLQKGTTSLISKSIESVFGSASKITGTLAKVVKFLKKVFANAGT
jgi:hypothetical protein